MVCIQVNLGCSGLVVRRDLPSPGVLVLVLVLVYSLYLLVPFRLSFRGLKDDDLTKVAARENVN